MCLIIFCCLALFCITNANANEFDNTGKAITFYPSSLMIAHNPRPALFYSDTHIFNLKLKLETTSFGKPPIVKTICSRNQQIFMNQVLKSVRQSHENVRRLLSLPGFTHLLECDSYLRRSYQYQTKLTSNMVCPRAYKPSLRSCKTWAIKKCQNISPDEKLWLKQLSRAKRSAWSCHAGFFGVD